MTASISCIPGGWVPITKALVKDLPHDRPYTRLEAMFSLTLDYDQGHTVSVCGYSKLWRWSEGRVRRFIEEAGARIEYPEKTASRQNQRGVIVIVIAEGSRSDRGGIKTIDSRWLRNMPEGSRSDDEGKAEGSCSATKDPNPKPLKTPIPKPKKLVSGSPLFTRFWEVYPNKKAKATAEKAWLKIHPDEQLLAEILTALERQKASDAWQKDCGRYIPHPATWLNGRRWEDEIEAVAEAHRLDPPVSPEQSAKFKEVFARYDN